MKKTLTALLLLLYFSSPQSQLAAQDIVSNFETQDWFHFDQNLRLAPDAAVEVYSSQLGITGRNQLELSEVKKDKLDWIHHTYQQTLDGIPVEFALLRVHERDGRPVKGNGKLVGPLDVATNAKLNETDALALAIECVGAESYYWESPQLELLKRYITDDPEATFWPRGELLVAKGDFDPESPAGYRLAWKFDIHSNVPERRVWVYVDASTGEIFKELDVHMHEGDHEGVAETRYSGTHDIITDSTEAGFVLRDYTRGRGIETFDARDSFDLSGATDYFDDDNYWANANDRAEDAATDAHWASAQLYDYLRDRHGWDSYDNAGSKMISYVHVGENWFNASWNGFWGRYGTAGGDPWTYIDVVGHEYAHGFIWATSGLIYSRESGAVNESFADILGEVLQYYIFDGETDWLLTPAPVDTIRSLRDPNTYDDPDTYLGENWWTQEGDNFGVHTNSGVMNYMFYLLVNGGAGTNNNGAEYSVEPIGMERAFDIIFRSMTTYLTPTSRYIDARQATLFAAEDLFGNCSEEYRQLANAWHAVGLGERQEAVDFSVTGVQSYDLCGLGDTETVTVEVEYLGCEPSGPVSLEMRLIKSNPPLSHTEMLEIPEGVQPGDKFTYTFEREFDFSRTGIHTLTARAASDIDLNSGNDELDAVTTFSLQQFDMHRFPFYLNFLPRTFRDSMAFIEEEYASIRVLPNIGRDSTVGLVMEGDRLRNANPVLPGQDFFDINPRLSAQICMCIDATALDSLGLQFDLRQTYSTEFEEIVGIAQPPSSGFRVLVDGEELARYIPETTNQDPWVTHNIDLENYLGKEFSICMEAKTYQSENDDEYNIGDKVFLDNVALIGSEVESFVGSLPDFGQLTVFPNPASTEVNIEVSMEKFADGEIRITDAFGRLIYSRDEALMAGVSRVALDVSKWAPGVYIAEVSAEGERFLGKLIVQ